MKTLQSELVKYRQFVSSMRLLEPQSPQQEANLMQQEHVLSRNSAHNSNKRYKRTPEELLEDVQRVDELVATGKFNQIEALQKIGLQSSVYHYKKRQLRAMPAKSDKPRKFAHRKRTKTKESYEEHKQKLLTQIEKEVAYNPDMRAKEAEQRFILLTAKYERLKEYVVNKCILGEK